MRRKESKASEFVAGLHVPNGPAPAPQAGDAAGSAAVEDFDMADIAAAAAAAPQPHLRVVGPPAPPLAPAPAPTPQPLDLGFLSRPPPGALPPPGAAQRIAPVAQPGMTRARGQRVAASPEVQDARNAIAGFVSSETGKITVKVLEVNDADPTGGYIPLTTLERVEPGDLPKLDDLVMSKLGGRPQFTRKLRYEIYDVDDYGRISMRPRVMSRTIRGHMDAAAPPQAAPWAGGSTMSWGWGAGGSWQQPGQTTPLNGANGSSSETRELREKLDREKEERNKADRQRELQELKAQHDREAAELKARLDKLAEAPKDNGQVAAAISAIASIGTALLQAAQTKADLESKRLEIMAETQRAEARMRYEAEKAAAEARAKEQEAATARHLATLEANAKRDREALERQADKDREHSKTLMEILSRPDKAEEAMVRMLGTMGEMQASSAKTTAGLLHMYAEALQANQQSLTHELIRDGVGTIQEVLSAWAGKKSQPEQIEEGDPLAAEQADPKPVGLSAGAQPANQPQQQAAQPQPQQTAQQDDSGDGADQLLGHIASTPFAELPGELQAAVGGQRGHHVLQVIAASIKERNPDSATTHAILWFTAVEQEIHAGRLAPDANPLYVAFKQQKPEQSVADVIEEFGASPEFVRACAAATEVCVYRLHHQAQQAQQPQQQPAPQPQAQQPVPVQPARRKKQPT